MTGSLEQADRISQLEAELGRMAGDLRESRARFQRAFEDPAMGMMTFSPAGDILTANAHVRRMLGYTRAELDRLNYKDITHPDDVAMSVESERRILSGEIHFDRLEKRYFHKNGDTVWVVLSCAMVHDAGGTPLYYVAHIQDITERKRAETALKESEQRFARFMDHLAAEAFIKDLEGRYIYANRFLEERLAARHPKGVIGLSDADIHPPDIVRDYAAHDRLALERGRAVEMVETGPGTEGERHWLTSRFPISRPGRPDLLGGLRFDITARVRAERELAAKEEEVEAKARSLEEVNTALKVLLDHRQEEKTRQARDLALGLEKLVSPYLEKLAATGLTPEQRTLADIALDNLRNVAGPLMSRMTGLESKLTPTEMDVADLIRHGKTADEIADLLSISSTTVAFHRRNIRSKLGLTNRKINLRSFLRGRE